MLRWILLAGVLTMACSSQPVREMQPAVSHPPMTCENAVECLLFPYGKYEQDVEVEVQAKDKAKTFSFECVVVSVPGELALVGHNGLGMSLFSIRQKQNQALEFRASIAEIEKNQEFFLKVFTLIKDVFQLKRADPRIKDLKMTLERDGLKSTVSFSDLDSEGVPKGISVAAPSLYEVSVKTVARTVKTGTDRRSR